MMEMGAEMGQLAIEEFEILANAAYKRSGFLPATCFAGIDYGDFAVFERALEERGLLQDGEITTSGLSALEPYRVKRAVFMAAGFGSRLMPITYNTPKPLVRVNGKRIIDTLLEAVAAAGIEEVFLVRGYLGEQFEQLLSGYPGIKFIENPVYNEANNISSVYVARDLLAGTYLIESDLLLRNPGIITPYQYSSNYIGVPTEETDDWCFDVQDGIIRKVMVGGMDCYHMFGISYWTPDDGPKLAQDISDAFSTDAGKQYYWDEVPLRYYLDDFEVRVRECTFDDVVEIDTFAELQDLDERYRIA